MPIIHRPSDDKKPVDAKPKEHECFPPSHDYSSAYKGWRTEEEEGAIWECSECGNHFVAVNKNQMISSNIWRRVRWYHFTAREVINREIITEAYGDWRL